MLEPDHKERRLTQAALSPADIDDILGRARDLLQKTQFAQAAVLCQQVLAADPTHMDGLYTLGVIQRYQGDITKALALENARKGVTVNALCPGYTETDIVREAVQNIVGKTGQSEAQARQALAWSGKPCPRLRSTLEQDLQGGLQATGVALVISARQHLRGIGRPGHLG